MRYSLVITAALSAIAALCQPPPPPPGGGEPPPFPGFPGFPGGGPPGGFRGGPGGFPGFGPPGNQEIVKDFDKNGDGWLNAEERKAAREELAKRPRGRGPGGRGGFPFGPRGGSQTPPQPGPKLSPEQVKSYGNEPLYDANVLRTIFIEFENPEWEAELQDFNNTDVDVPATIRVDGKIYRDVGVHFRGMSSFMMVPAGRKRSLNLSMDFLHKDQRLHGYKTLNLLNAHGDPTYLRAVLYLDIARNYLPANKANLMRVVINGESWGIYINQQQFNTDFIKEWFQTTKGARWKVTGSPMGQGGLSYLGDDPAAYKKIYSIRSKDDPQDWAALIHLTRILTKTPLEHLEKELEPVFNIDGAIKFLALEKALINSDGYWVRSSDYSIYRDPKGKFHLIPHDTNEAIRPPEGGPGMRGQNMGKGYDLDPFAGAQENRVLLSRFLAVPSIRARYIAQLKDIAKNWMSWSKLGPMAANYQALIDADVKADTRKLDTYEAFLDGVATDKEETAGGFRGPGGPPAMSIKTFVEERRKFLLDYTEKKQ